MYVGLPNPNILMPLEKMTVSVMSGPFGGASFEVLFNPESYVQTRQVHYAQSHGIATNSPVTQFAGGGLEILKFRLFFDALSAGSEVGGTMIEKLAFAGNSLLPSRGNGIDVRKYTSRIYGLMEIDPDLHAPPLVALSWASLQFTGHLIACEQEFVKFSESGAPVRAWLTCTFQEFIPPSEINKARPLESPDTTKYRTVQQGDTLWSLSAKEYGQPEQWRSIAAANGLANPRLLRTGERLSLPALKK